MPRHAYRVGRTLRQAAPCVGWVMHRRSIGTDMPGLGGVFATGGGMDVD
jgi:hypothetical protein